MDLKEFFESLSKREVQGLFGLDTSHYRALAPCLGDGACRAQVLSAGTAQEWDALLKSAPEKVIYQGDDAVIDSWLAVPDITDNRSLVKASGPVIEAVTAGAVMDFHVIGSTAKQDHEGDILHPEGAELDPKMALLWQHIPMLPIGRFLRPGRQDKKLWSAFYSIVNSELGRDAARLVEFGALRFSHGFLPKVYERLKEEDKAEGRPWPGMRVRKYRVLEGSLVSVPANDEAVITAYSRQKLAHPFVKSWAETLWRERPVVVRAPGTVGGNGASHPPEEPCGCGGKGTDQGEVLTLAQVEELYTRPMPNFHACRLKDPARFQPDSFRTTKRKSDGKEYSVIMGRLKGDTAMTEQSYRYPKESWSAADARAHCNGHDGSTFEAASESSATPEPKQAKISQRNLRLLKEASELLADCMQAEIAASYKAMLEKAHGNVGKVIADAGGDEERCADLAVKLLASILKGGELDLAAIDTLSAALSQQRPLAEERALAAFAL